MDLIRGIIVTVDRVISKAITALLVTVVLSMVFLSFFQVVLRNVTGGGISWADVILRHLVLIVGMLGAVLAARHGRQISIDVLGRIIPSRYRPIVLWIAGLFTIVVTFLLTKASIQFVVAERSFGTELASGIAAWPFQLAIPIGFTLVGFQVLLNLLLGRDESMVPDPALEAAEATLKEEPLVAEEEETGEAVEEIEEESEPPGDEETDGDEPEVRE